MTHAYASRVCSTVRLTTYSVFYCVFQGSRLYFTNISNCVSDNKRVLSTMALKMYEYIPPCIYGPIRKRYEYILSYI